VDETASGTVAWRGISVPDRPDVKRSARMPPSDCYNRIRCSLSDESGDLCFKSFEIVGAPGCSDIQEKLEAYLVGRPLAAVDLAYLQGLECPGSGECMGDVVRVVREHQDWFVRAEKDR
jgi:hypothetical protein